MQRSVEVSLCIAMAKAFRRFPNSSLQYSFSLNEIDLGKLIVHRFLRRFPPI